MVGGGAQSQQKINSTYGIFKQKNLTKSVRIRLKEWSSRLQIRCLWIFRGGLPSQILPYRHRKSFKNELLQKNKEKQEQKLACGGGQKTLKMKTFHTKKCKKNSKELSGISSWYWQQKRCWLQTSEKSASEKGKKLKPIPTSWHSTNPILPRKRRLVITQRGLNSMSQFPWGASNVRNMDTTGKLAKNNRHVSSAVEKTQTTQTKSAWMKWNVKTAIKTIQLTHDLATFIKCTKKYCEWNTRKTSALQ